MRMYMMKGLNQGWRAEAEAAREEWMMQELSAASGGAGRQQSLKAAVYDRGTTSQGDVFHT